MSHSQVSLTDASSVDNGEFRLLDLLIVVTRYKKLILGAVLTALVLASAISYFLPHTYMASAQLLPPRKQTSGAVALLSQVGGVAAVAGLSSLKTPASLHIGMLKSRVVADKLIARFGLKRWYGMETEEETRRALARDTRIVANKHGLITLTVEATDKKLAAQLANGYIEELTKLERQLATDSAAQLRTFFRRELETARQQLATAESTYKQGRERGGLNSPAAETQSVVENVATLRRRISAQEVELNAMRAFVTNRDSQFRREQEELASLRQELARLRDGASPGGGSPADARISQPARGNASLLRDVNYYQILTDLLARQYEGARLHSAGDASSVQVLDTAVEPEESPKPRRFLIVVLCGLSGAIIGLSCAFVAEAQRRFVLDPQGKARWTVFRTHLAPR